MIGYLSGKVIGIDAQEKRLLLMAQNVGYLVCCNTDLLAKTNVNQGIELFIHTAVREDDIALYGFETKEEYAFFKQLIGVSGIGPKSAMEILAAPLAVTQNAIVAEDANLLTRIKGIGKKTAERIILELKGKVAPVTMGKGKPLPLPYSEDAVLALEGLGYERMHVIKVLSQLPKTVTKTSDIVKYFLKQAT